MADGVVFEQAYVWAEGARVTITVEVEHLMPGDPMDPQAVAVAWGLAQHELARMSRQAQPLAEPRPLRRGPVVFEER